MSDNAVPLAAHADRAAKVPNIILSGSESALGEWTFALNNGSMPEEPVMIAAVMLGDGRSRIAIAYEASLIGKEYLTFAEKAYSAKGLKVVATVAIPQVEADKAEAVKVLRAAEPDALVHVGFGHGLWGFSDALLAADWDPPRYTTTAFEMAHINAEWMLHLRGWIGLDSYDERNEVGQSFLDRFDARYGRRPGHSMPGLAYDVATVIVRGLSAARPLTGEGVKLGIEQVKLVQVDRESQAAEICGSAASSGRAGWARTISSPVACCPTAVRTCFTPLPARTSHGQRPRQAS